LCARSIAAGSFAFGVAAALGVAEALCAGLAEAAVALALGDAVALAAGSATTVLCAGVGDPALTVSCVDSRPAIARPTANTKTSANGSRVNAVRMRRMARRYGFFATVTTA
jgi:hypothetical protein